jgi:solute carrier family 35 protein F5
MLMTSPLAVTLGISLTIPLAVAGDMYRGTPVSWKTLMGGALVLGSFVANGLIDLAIAEEALADVIIEGDIEGGAETPPQERDRLLGPRQGDDAAAAEI